MNILGVDIGGTNVKFRTEQKQVVKVPSGPKMTPDVMMAAIQAAHRRLEVRSCLHRLSGARHP